MSDTLDLGTLAGKLSLDPTSWLGGLAAGEKGAAGFKGKALLAFTGVGLGAAAVGVALYKIGGVFDDVSDTIRVGTGATGKDLDSLVDSAKRVGTEIPASFDEIGPVVADLNTRLGLTGPALEKLSEQFLEAGRITGEALDVNTITGALSAFNVKGAETSDALDQIYQVSQATGVSMNDLGAALRQGAPNLTQFGFSIGESAVLLGSLDKAGLDGSKTTMALSRAMVSFAKDGKEPKKALADTISGIESLVKSGDQAGAINMAAKIFGTRGAGQFVAAVKAGKLNLDDLSKATGQTSDTILKAGQDTGDFAEQWMVFKNRALVAVEPLATRVFNSLGQGMAWVNAVGVPALMSLGDEFTSVGVFISGVIGWLRSLSGEGDKTGSKAGQLAATFRSVWANIQAIFRDSISIITTWWGAFGGILTSYIRNGFSNMITILRGAFNVIAGIFRVVAALLKGDWAGVWAGIQQILRGVVGILRGLVSQLWNIIRTLFAAGGAALRGIWSGIWSGMRSLASAGIASVVGMIRGIPGKMMALAGSFGSAGRALISAFVNGMKNAGGIVSGIAGNVWSAVKGLLNQAIGKLRSALNFSIGIPGPDIHVNVGNSIPYLADGGYVDRPTVAMIGEAGPEVVAPLSGSKGKAAMASLGSGPGNSEDLALQLAELLDETRAQNDLLAAVADRDIMLNVNGRQAGTIYRAGQHVGGRL